MNLADVDLNLLVVFDRLLHERSVSRSAVSLGLSQPAVSNALRRLRDLLGDELFLRTPAGMAPTPYAMQLAQPVAQALQTLHAALNVRASFDAETSNRCFTVAMTDVGETYFLPVLMDLLAQQAPSVTLRCVSVTTPDLRDTMSSGGVDLALGSLPQMPAGFYQQALFRQRYVLLMRQSHPLADAAHINASLYRQARHVRVEAHGTAHHQVEEALAQRGIRRQVCLSVPHYVALGHVLCSTDLVATVPERFADRVTEPLGLVARPLAWRLPVSIIGQYWHAHLHRDPGHRWLRDLMVRYFGQTGQTERSL